MTNPVLDTLMKRRSHRKYLPTQLREEHLQALIDAALQSPSAVNRQPWHFSVVQNSELLKRINAAAHRRAASLPQDVRGLRFDDPSFNLFYGAPTAIIISSPGDAMSTLDCGIAVQSLAIAAKSLGLGSVIVALSRFAFEDEDGQALMEALEFPDGYRFAISIALGTPDDDKPAHEMNPHKVSILR